MGQEAVPDPFPFHPPSTSTPSETRRQREPGSGFNPRFQSLVSTLVSIGWMDAGTTRTRYGCDLPARYGGAHVDGRYVFETKHRKDRKASWRQEEKNRIGGGS
eukprot:scaffold810_cov355-Pavlova_lutheri.AAC.11